MILKSMRILILSFIAFLPSSFASAHEVYVLPQDVIDTAIHTPGMPLMQILLENLNQFLLWGFMAILLVFIIFFTSISHTLEERLDPFLAKLPPFAPVISRITIGLAFLAAAYYGALFGPELPLGASFGAYTPIITALLIVLGLMIIVGFYTRVAAIIAGLIFLWQVSISGEYMFTYANYAGELILLIILGAHKFAYHHKGHDVRRAPRALLRLKEILTPYTFLILRVAFGASLLYASIYAKIIHNELALAVAATPLAGHATSLASVFGFSPEFLVLGAAIVEIVIGTFFILGIEIRFTSLFLLFWLSLSLWYFGEVVWPHIVLIGIPIAFIFYGYDKYSLEGFFFKRNGRDPVL
ncbi:DoxX family membrane protein [Candidatus Parcubacteria bacterium]|uniref:DoxX family protein n=1 Tax=Candidatus Kaiserbacteria bacterium CG10_big_fil_rev_8_21_14_0_10_47_16 TaxID=1974608 RepID=A0A2H0UEV8_9BACT|nr:DoxX family membrane protein [Candidatus Parcubacteria bacterium]PIR84305.1 MAG: hypothetical protein COU16_01780 [Candidatus Kaiserbacteria bacterium CG10_big_fil_rev_8_21_14_0_10_47_16]